VGWVFVALAFVGATIATTVGPVARNERVLA